METKEKILKPILKDLNKFILDILFPISCIVCGKEDEEFICKECKTLLPGLTKQYCIICQKPSLCGITHPLCKTPFAPEGLVSMFNYHDKNVSEILITGKYKFIPIVYKQLSKLLYKFLYNNFAFFTSEADAIIPLPLHIRRFRWRGFNQSEILASELSALFEKPMLKVLKRTKPTQTQKDLKKEQRIKNVEDAFKIALNTTSPQVWGESAEGGREVVDIKGKNLILIDDVTTTGSTLLEAVKVLKRNGCGKVWCVTVARD
jgi:competence protein ComFC